MILHMCNDIICRGVSGVKSVRLVFVFLGDYCEVSTSFATGFLDSSRFYPEPDNQFTFQYKFLDLSRVKLLEKVRSTKGCHWTQLL